MVIGKKAWCGVVYTVIVRDLGVFSPRKCSYFPHLELHSERFLKQILDIQGV